MPQRLARTGGSYFQAIEMMQGKRKKFDLKEEEGGGCQSYSKEQLFYTH